MRNPLRGVHAERFTAALLSAVDDPAVRALPPVGGIDQFVDSTDALGDMATCRALTRAALRMGREHA